MPRERTDCFLILKEATLTNNLALKCYNQLVLHIFSSEIKRSELLVQFIQDRFPNMSMY